MSTLPDYYLYSTRRSGEKNLLYRSTGAPRTNEGGGAIPDLHITDEGTYYAQMRGIWYEAELSYLSTPILGALLHGTRHSGTPHNLDPSPLVGRSNTPFNV